MALSVDEAEPAHLLADLGYTLGYFATILTLAWRPKWVLAPFMVMLGSALFAEYEFGPLLMAAIILTLASYVVRAVPLTVMVAAALGWEFGWRVLHDAVDGRLLWPVPIVIFLLLPGRVLRTLVQRAQRDRVSALAREELAREREETLAAANKRHRLVVSRELHDVVAHELTRIAMQASIGQLSSNPQEQQQSLKTISTSSRTAMTEMRRLVRLLHDETLGSPPGEGTGSLELAREVERAARYLSDLGFLTDWRIEGDLEGIPPGLLPTSVTILRETTTNAVKHSSPGVRCKIFVEVGDDLTIDVRNELSAGHLHPPESGVGLAGLRSRVADLQGCFVSGSRDGWWIVRATMPLGEAA